MTWLQQAACTDTDPELFFTRSNESTEAKRYREKAAKAVCSACPVSQQCLEFSLPVAEYGIFGGKSEDARRKERRRRGIVREKADIAPCGTASGARRHQRNGEPPCATCAAAALEYGRTRRASSRDRAKAVAS